jgi:cytochrome c biogenesis protein CcdA
MSETDQLGADERRHGERRRTDRRGAPGRRAEDIQRARWHVVWAAIWAILGALVVLYLFLLAIGGINPDNARGVSIAALVVGVIWVAHAWRRLWMGGFSSRPDRERRGF